MIVILSFVRKKHQLIIIIIKIILRIKLIIINALTIVRFVKRQVNDINMTQNIFLMMK